MVSSIWLYVAIDGKNLRPFPREQHAFGAAVARARPDATGAGDKCDLARETAWHFLCCCELDCDPLIAAKAGIQQEGKDYKGGQRRVS